jgi:hypothetical protein
MIERTPLPVTALSAAAQRALGPGPGKLMAARGIMPLPPGDQLSVLYQLATGTEEALAQQARNTIITLPEKLLVGTLATALDPRVLDLFAELVADKPAVTETLILNAVTADGTVATIAGRAESREVDLIAQNEQRLLRHPEIIAAMYMNRRARMSTIDRVVELAVRNNVRVPGLAAWDEVARAITGATLSSAEDDEKLARMLADTDDQGLTAGTPDELPAAELAEGEQPAEPEVAVDANNIPRSIPAQIRLATLGNAVQRNFLIRSPLRPVAMAAVRSPAVKDIEVMRWAGNHALHEDVIRHIAGKREWTKSYNVKVLLCRNPKAPIAEITRLLPFLREKDLAMLSKSKGVPSAVAAQARKLVMQRRGPTK